MILIVVSEEDKASINIGNHLMNSVRWNKIVNKLYRYEDIVLTFIDDEHLYHDNIDSEIEKKIKIKFDTVIFASKHKSESGVKTLSVHPVGNYSKPEYGGMEKTLVNTSPHLMTNALRIMKKKNKTYHVCFEVTHHGPCLKTPAFFIEIGSDEKCWKDENAGKILAETIIETVKNPEKHPVLIGVGGGHYAPRFTEIALSKKVSFAHMLPKYQIENIDESMVDEIIQKSKPDFVYFHRKGMKKSDYRKLKEVFENKGIKAVREEELEDIQ